VEITNKKEDLESTTTISTHYKIGTHTV